MAFLTINGQTHSIRADRGRAGVDHIGEGFRRSFSGQGGKSIRTTKRTYDDLSSTILIPRDAQWLARMIKGDGDSWRFGGEGLETGDLTADSDIVSGKGGAPQNNVSTFLPMLAADGDPIASHYEIGDSVAVDPASQNIAATRDTDGDQAAWSTDPGSSLADTAAHYLIGSGSVEADLQPPGLGDAWVERDSILTGAAPATAYIASAYVKYTGGGTGETLRVYLRDVSNGIDGTAQTITLDDEGWIRVKDAAVTTGAGPASLDLRFEIDGAQVPVGGIQFAIDGIQIEQASFSTSFYNSASARAAGKCDFPAAEMTTAKSGLTFFCFTAGPGSAAISAGSRSLFNVLGDQTQNRCAFYVTSGGILRCDVYSAAGVQTSVSTAFAWDGNMYFVGLIVDFVTGIITISIDGVAIAQGSILPADAWDPSAFDSVRIGQGFNTVSQWTNYIGDPVLYPYPANQEKLTEAIGAMEARVQRYPQPPLLRVYGDVIDAYEIDAYGELGAIDIVSASSGSAWNSSFEMVNFSLREK